MAKISIDRVQTLPWDVEYELETKTPVMILRPVNHPLNSRLTPTPVIQLLPRTHFWKTGAWVFSFTFFETLQHVYHIYYINIQELIPCSQSNRLVPAYFLTLIITFTLSPFLINFSKIFCNFQGNLLDNNF